MNFAEIWMCVKWPIAFSFIAIVVVFTFARLRRSVKKSEETLKEIRRNTLFKYSDFIGTPPEGVNYKWCRLYKGGESYGGEVELDEARLKKSIGDGYYPVPYERHQDVTETLDPKKLSIQLDGFILVQKEKPNERSDYKKMIEDGIENKDDHIKIEGEHDGFKFKLDIKSD